MPSKKKADVQQTKASRVRRKPSPRKPGSGNGKNRRTPAQLERQERVFDFSVMQGMTVRQIAAELKISQQTVIADMRAEEMRRSGEIAKRREQEKARSVAFYQGVARLALAIAQSGELPGDSARMGDAIKARERIDKILGLDAPSKVEIGPLQDLLGALEGE